jgi:DHHC palmitoyltransferase
MSKYTERLERAILFSSLITEYTLNSIVCLDTIQNYPSRISLYTLLVTGFLSIFYAVLCLCYRGYINLEMLPETDFITKKCNYCQQWKPERSHHCSKCKKCIRKMDHHCHWLGRCINYDNQGHFIRFLFFTFLSNLNILVYNCYQAFQYIFHKEQKITKKFAILLVGQIMFAFTIGCVTLMHTTSQMKMVLANETFIEVCQRRNLEILNRKCRSSPYNIGLLHNITEVLGPFYFLFLWKPNGNGTDFKKTWPSSYWPRDESIREDAFYEVV